MSPWIRRSLILTGDALVVLLLSWFEVVPTWPGLALLIALPPMDLFADMRLIVARSPDVPSVGTATRAKPHVAFAR
jgi:hypothetical protein